MVRDRFVTSVFLRTGPTRGVYALTVDGGVQYIGEAEDLTRRYNMGYGHISPRNCYTGGRATNCRLNHLIYKEASKGRKVDLWFYRTEDRLAAEAELIRSLQPPWNRKGI